MNAAASLAERRYEARDSTDVELRYRQLLASVTDYVYTVSVQDSRPAGTSHGPGCTAVTGYSPQEFQADPFLWIRMVFKDDSAAVLDQAEKILAGKTPPPLEHRIVRKDGSIRWIRNTAVPHKDPQGTLLSYDGLVADITERKEAEIALSESQERLALVIQGSRDGIWDWNLVTNQVYFSARWKGMLGYEKHEIENHFSGWLRLIHPEDWDHVMAHIDAYLAGDTPNYEVEHRLRHKDGSYRWILARGVVSHDASGKPVRFVGSHVDLTERKQVEEKLRITCGELSRKQTELEQALDEASAAHQQLQATQLHLIQIAKMESVGTLAAGVAHEVKNPLQTILMGLDYLDSAVVGPDANLRMVLGDMRDAVRRGNTIIRELLQFSGNRDFEQQSASINEVIEDSLRLMKKEFMASKVQIRRELKADLPLVRIDKTKMEQVFLNLLINAVQAMPQGGRLTVASRRGVFGDEACLTAANAHFDPGENVVIVEVEDTGTGIAPADLQRVFDPFFTTKPAGQGTGLGLSVAKTIVEIHGGLIALRNGAESGVVVTLILRTAPNANPSGSNKTAALQNTKTMVL